MWGRHNDFDVATASLEVFSRNDTVMGARLVGTSPAPRWKNAVATYFETRDRFYAENPAAIDMATALSRWILNYRATNALDPLETVSLKTIWHPLGYLLCMIEQPEAEPLPDRERDQARKVELIHDVQAGRKRAAIVGDTVVVHDNPKVLVAFG